MEREDITVAIA